MCLIIVLSTALGGSTELLKNIAIFNYFMCDIPAYSYKLICMISNGGHTGYGFTADMMHDFYQN